MGGKPGLGGQGCSASIAPGPRRDWVQLLGLLYPPREQTPLQRPFGATLPHPQPPVKGPLSPIGPGRF